MGLQESTEVCIKTHASGHITPPILPSSPTPLRERNFFLIVGHDGQREELCVALLHLCLSHPTNVYVLSALDSRAPSTDGELTQFGDGRVTAKEMYPHINESALLWKIDIRVIPSLCLLFLFAFLDRVNVGNASVYGMTKDLGLVGNQYNVALAIL